MKILIVSQYYFPEQFLINEIAPELVKKGNDVTVLCGLPNYPKGKIYNGYEKAYKKVEVINGVRVIRSWLIGRKSGLFNLFLNYLTFAVAATIKIFKLKNKFDIILAYQLSPVSSAIPAAIYAKVKHIPSLIYCMDIWPESISYDIQNKNSILFRLVHLISRKIYSSFDKIVVSSRSFIDYLKITNKISTNKIVYLPQHASSAMLYMELTAAEDNISDFMFAGNLGFAQNLDVIVKAAETLGKRKDYRIHFVGDGSFRPELEIMVKKAGLSEIIFFHGYQNKDDMPEYYKMADALLITLNGNDAVGKTLPSKFQTYITTGKPIIGALNGDGHNAIIEAACGECVFAGDYKGLANIMLNFIEKPHTFKELGLNGRRFFKNNYSLDIFIESLETNLKSTIKSYHN